MARIRALSAMGGGSNGYTWVAVSLQPGSSSNPYIQTVTSADLGGKTPKKILYGFIQNNFQYGYGYMYDEDLSTTLIYYTFNNAWVTGAMDRSQNAFTIGMAIEGGDVIFYNKGPAIITGYAVIITD